MESILQKLDQNLSSLRPEFYKTLQEPLNNADIEALEKKYNVILPEDLKALYKWKNGQEANNFESFVNNSMFIPLDEALDIASENTSMIGFDFEIENWWNAKWIPLFHNGGGDYICYDGEGTFTGNSGQIIEFWHADNDRDVIAPNLESFLSQLNSYFESNQVEDFDEYFEVEKIQGYPKRFIVD
ncbi:SMI1/KNR4 family protein [Flavobacterium artemisiae]|uniref:SMI1/KNR4 family protein n=1 Tax=Flavobacterium artemisiae TaxID=2126556 RepID=A0ABW4HHQ6_9FLAO